MVQPAPDAYPGRCWRPSRRRSFRSPDLAASPYRGALVLRPGCPKCLAFSLIGAFLIDR